MSRNDHIISAADAVAQHDDLVFLEVEPWYPHGAPVAAEPVPGIAGAIASSVAEHFGTRETRAPGEGGRPLPSPDELTETIRSWGLSRDTPVVVYTADPEQSRSAARAWFTLRWAGLTNVRVLDGQLAAWVAAGGAVGPAGASSRPRSHFEVTPGSLPTIDADAAGEIGRDGVLLDARPTKAYVAGHIPGALGSSSSDITRDGFLLPEDELREWFDSRGLSGEVPRGTYCGGGVAAAALTLGAATLGIELPLYVASWSGWSAESRPVETSQLEEKTA